MITINREKCRACGICEQVCPRHIPELVSGEGKQTVVLGERVSLCMACGHCVALCPQGAITVKKLNPDEFLPVKKLEIGKEQLLTLVKQRRSIRRYKEKPVSREHLDSIIHAASHAPSGTGSMSTGVIVVTNPGYLQKLSELTYALYENLDRALKNPIARWIIKRKIGYPTFLSMRDFVMPGMRWYIKWYREGKSDEIFRNSRAILLFTSPRMEPRGDENCVIAAFQAILMAETLGVGTCFNHLIPEACNRDKQIRELLQLPDDREVYASITLGYPMYKFQRTIPRHLAEVKYLE